MDVRTFVQSLPFHLDHFGTFSCRVWLSDAGLEQLGLKGREDGRLVTQSGVMQGSLKTTITFYNKGLDNVDCEAEVVCPVTGDRLNGSLAWELGFGIQSIIPQD